ncbi:MAG: hypothetical protein K0R65_2664 [Crocinitomicaceae bacterium]|jgi:hypothetical protein|nr:hypothetical protein [Crocinitomicaceae bacterium]
MKNAFLFCFLICYTAFGQANLPVEVSLFFKGEKLELEKWYIYESEKQNEKDENVDSVLFESLRFYLSGFELTKKGKSVWKEKESYHLIDAENPASCQINLNFAKNTDFDGLKFNLGIDSITNSGGVKGGDLDPVKGMYWTWQTGYIHFKLEGKSNLCPTRDNQFSLHLGGYSFSQNTMQSLSFDLKNPEKAVLELDLSDFLRGIDFKNLNHVMSPGAEAVRLSQQAAALFLLR